jgi:hemerythrin-like metal-binding protein
MPIKWNKAFSVGHPEIDKHHKRIIKLINTLQKAVGKGTDEPVIPKILEELSSYANYHFGTEENMFLRSAYPDTEYHVGQHEEFRKYISRLKELIDRKEHIQGVKLLEYLNSWFVDHIVKIDMRMTPYIIERKEEN